MPSNSAASAALHVEVVVERRLESGADPVDRAPGQRGVVGAVLAVRGERRQQGVDPGHRGAGGGERLVGEVERRPVVDRDQRVAQGARPRSRPRSARRPERCCRSTWPSSRRPSGGGRSAARSARTAGRWRPRTGRSRPRGAGTRGRPAGVDVERGPEVGHAHRGALDVPARPPLPDRGRPRRLAGLGTLPQREVADVVLAVLVGLDPLAHSHRLGSRRASRP